jgi:hypothetical protein
LQVVGCTEKVGAVLNLYLKVKNQEVLPLFNNTSYSWLFGSPELTVLPFKYKFNTAPTQNIFLNRFS